MAAKPEEEPKPKTKTSGRRQRQVERQKNAQPQITGRIRTRPKKAAEDIAIAAGSNGKPVIRRASLDERKKRPRAKPRQGRDYQPLIHAKNGMRIDDMAHDTGYGKPPEGTKFQPGQCGNPKGRPKGRKNIATLFKEALQQKIVSRSGNREKTITAREGIAQRAVQKALEGDPRFVKLVMQQDNLFDMELLQEQIEQAEEQEVDADDAAILEEFMRQILEKENSSSKKDEADKLSSDEPDDEGAEDGDDDT